MENNVINLNSIDAYNKLYGFPTLHPLVTVVDMTKASQFVNNVRMKYGVYALFLKNDSNCALKYGRRHYDYQEGTVVSFSPGQVIDMAIKPESTSLNAIGLVFHPDLIYGTPLGKRISEYNFFNYSQLESVHLSEEERATFLDCLDKISHELVHPVDRHSAAVLSANIQLLLEYMNRFYDRQFITRHKVNSDIIVQFEKHLKEYYSVGNHSDELPSVTYFAEKANLTPGYFGDLVKKETGSTAKDIITQHMVALAKHRLAVSDDDISIIAYDLGFQYPAHFTRLFKRVTGQSPTAYRNSLG